ncbi:MAG: hypothetical protein J6S23_08245 [Clostridia bacterium]|nr:hypothetical protein [Clostridia bacterium]
MMSDVNVLELEVQNDENLMSEMEDVPEQEETSQDDELSKLQGEIEALRTELRAREETERAQSRFLSEIAEFEQYFPEVDMHSIPDEIWEKVKNGSSLASSYALFLRRRDLEKKKVGDFNEKNRRMSAGSLMRGEGEKYFSPSEVKKMTPAQVRSNYDDIVASMKHWN